LAVSIVTFAEHSEALGSQLSINLPEEMAPLQEFFVTIDFTTMENLDNKTNGLSWLLAEQTVGKKHPYFYTQF
jgi:leukotriene-A4 hydrolase